jgi:chromosome segregation ATPase
MENRTGEQMPEGERSPLHALEEKIAHLLNRYQTIKKERDELAAALDLEREKTFSLERRMESLSQDKEKVKAKIDQLLQRLKGIEI